MKQLSQLSVHPLCHGFHHLLRRFRILPLALGPAYMQWTSVVQISLKLQWIVQTLADLSWEEWTKIPEPYLSSCHAKTPNNAVNDKLNIRLSITVIASRLWHQNIKQRSNHQIQICYANECESQNCVPELNFCCPRKWQNFVFNSVDIFFTFHKDFLAVISV